MCLDVRNECKDYLNLLSDEQRTFIDCNATENGEPKFENGGECYSLTSLSQGCGPGIKLSPY